MPVISKIMVGVMIIQLRPVFKEWVEKIIFVRVVIKEEKSPGVTGNNNVLNPLPPYLILAPKVEPAIQVAVNISLFSLLYHG